MTIRNVGEWIPVNKKIPTKVFFVNQIIDNHNGLEIKLISEEQDEILKICFEENVFEYCSIEESCDISRLNMLVKKYGNDFFTNNKILYRVKESEFIKRFCEKSGGVTDESEVLHFAIITSDYFIDIASNNEPIVSYMYI